jgi:2'-5' RNA ligase
MDREPGMNRSVLLFPDLPNLPAIQEIRDKYDPLHDKIRPHITLVFPFDTSMDPADLEVRVRKCLSGRLKFEIETGRVFYTDDHFIQLAFASGNGEITALHDALYADVFPEFLNRKYPYTPHVTLGYLEDGFKVYKLMKELTGFSRHEKTLIDKVYVETIGAEDESVIEFSINLD